MRPISKIGLVFFAALLLMPGALKSAHIFSDHQHFFCDHSSESHLHQKTYDCNLVSQQQPAFPSFDLLSFEVFTFEEHHKINISSYLFLIDHHFESTSPRGPPAVA